MDPFFCFSGVVFVGFLGFFLGFLFGFWLVFCLALFFYRVFIGLKRVVFWFYRVL